MFNTFSHQGNAHENYNETWAAGQNPAFKQIEKIKESGDVGMWISYRALI